MNQCKMKKNTEVWDEINWVDASDTVNIGELDCEWKWTKNLRDTMSMNER